MAVVKCDNGHFYDAVKYSSCPHCGAPGDVQPKSQVEDSQTIAVMQSQAVPVVLEPQMSSVATGVIEPQTNIDIASIIAEDPKTVAFTSTSSASGTGGISSDYSKVGTDPVTGWLVCIEGGSRGRDYRIHSGQNFIGRSIAMDVSIEGDETINRENHCVLVYDPKGKTFYLRGEKSSVYLNDELMTGVGKLNDHDTIQIGNSKFVFVQFCTGEFSWS